MSHLAEPEPKGDGRRSLYIFVMFLKSINDPVIRVFV